MAHARTSSLVDYLVREAGLLTDDVVLVDVGCSGGLSKSYRTLEPKLSAVAFDPLANEVERLASIEVNPKVRYIAAWLTAEANHVPLGPGNWWDRSSAVVACAHPKVTGRETKDSGPRKYGTAATDDYVQKEYNAGAPLVYTERRIILSDFLEEEGLAAVDILKIDTDGHDVLVLIGAARFLERNPPLKVEIECGFNADPKHNQSLLTSADQILRPLGLTLVDIDVWRYSRAALPGRFYGPITAQTDHGPIAWCMAYYVDDPLSAPGKLDAWLENGLQRCFKLLAIYELQGLPDCAAELIMALKAHPASATAAKWDHMLDLLVPRNPFGATTHADYLGEFHADPRRFLPANWPRS